MDDHLVRLMCSLCVQSATELIQRIYQNLENNYRSSAWHSIYCKHPEAMPGRRVAMILTRSQSPSAPQCFSYAHTFAQQ